MRGCRVWVFPADAKGIAIAADLRLSAGSFVAFQQNADANPTSVGRMRDFNKTVHAGHCAEYIGASAVNMAWMITQLWRDLIAPLD